MNLQPASEHNITHGQAQIMGAVTARDGQKAWMLPGGKSTLSREVAERAAKVIDRLISRQATD